SGGAMKPNIGRNRGRRTAMVAAALAAAFALLVAPTQAAPAPVGTEEATPAPVVEDLGPAVMSVNVRSAAFGELADGTPVGYAVSNGNPATFTMVDVTTGESLFAAELDGATLGGWMLVDDDDGMVYFTARHPMPGGLFSFDPSTSELTNITERVAGE